MIFFLKVFVAVNMLFLTTIIAAHKFTHDYLLDENFLETKNESKSEKNRDIATSTRNHQSLDNVAFVKKSNTPNGTLTNHETLKNYGSPHLSTNQIIESSIGPQHVLFSDVQLVKTSFLPFKASAMRSAGIREGEYKTLVSKTNNSNNTANAEAKHPSDMVFFAFDSFELDQAALDTLQNQITYLRENPEARITIEGHTDELGTREYNLALGERRASSVKDHFLSAGVNEARIKTISYGKERPMTAGTNDYARSKNRRAVTVVLYPAPVKVIPQAEEKKDETAVTKYAENQEPVTPPNSDQEISTSGENKDKTATKNKPSKQKIAKRLDTVSQKKKTRQSPFADGRFYLGFNKHLQAGGQLGWDDVGSTTLVTRLSNFEPENFELNEFNFGYRKSNFAVAVAYADHRSFKLKGSPATIGGTNYSFFEVPVRGHSYSLDASLYVPISKNFADFSVTAGVGTAKFTTGFAGVNGTDSVDKMYTNSDVKFTRLGAGVDFYLSPTLILSTALMQSKYDDFGITLDPAGSANLTAKNMKINTMQIGLKKYF